VLPDEWAAVAAAVIIQLRRASRIGTDRAKG